MRPGAPRPGAPAPPRLDRIAPSAGRDDLPPGEYLQAATALGTQIMGTLSWRIGEDRTLALAKRLTTFRPVTPEERARQARDWAAILSILLSAESPDADQPAAAAAAVVQP